MTKAPRPPGLRPGGAAEIETGLEQPVYTVSAAQSQALLRLRRQREVARICRIPRLVLELLDEVGRHYGIADEIDDRLARFAALDPDILAAVGGDKFVPVPTRLVGGGA